MPQLDIFSTPGTFTYTVPSDYTKFDIVCLGGGGGGQGGGALNSNGEGGNAAIWASTTVVRGVGIPSNATSFSITVGVGGTRGLGPTKGVGTNGGASSVAHSGTTLAVSAGGILGSSGATGGDTTGHGTNPTTYSYGGRSYVGGVSRSSGQVGAPPGAGGCGGNGNVFAGDAGFAGAAGSVWIFAYAKVADAQRAVTATGTVSGLRNALVASTTTTVNAFSTGNSLVGQTISYTLGAAGTGGSGATNGTAGGTTTVTFNGITLTASGGGGGIYNSTTANTGGTGSGGDSAATGGKGGVATGDQGGGGGGAVGGTAGSAGSGGAGGAGAQSTDVSGLQAAITGAGGNWTSGGAGSVAGSSGTANVNNGGAATGGGCGGGGAGYWGGNGGAAQPGGGGGGASGYTAVQTGGAGGQGAVVCQFTGAATPYVILTSGTSITVPAGTTAVKIWAVGAGGGGAGSPATDTTSGGGGAAGGVAVVTVAAPASQSSAIRFNARPTSLPTAITASRTGAIRFNARPTVIQTAITATRTGILRKGMSIAATTLAVTASRTAAARLTGRFSTALAVTAARTVTPSLVYLVNVEPNLVISPNFENNTVARPLFSGSATGAYTTEESYSGTTSFKWTVNGATWNGPYLGPTAGTGRHYLTGTGNTYRATVRVKPKAGNNMTAGYVRLWMRWWKSDFSTYTDSAAQAYVVNNASMSANWFELSCIGYQPVDRTGGLDVFVISDPSTPVGNVYYIDDASVVMLPKTTVAVSGAGKLTGMLSGSRPTVATGTVTGLRNALVNASQTVTNTRTSTGLRNARVAAAQSITATRTAASRINASATALAPIVVDEPAAVSQRQLLQSSLSVSLARTAIPKLQGGLSATQTISSTITTTGLRNALVNASQSITLARPSILNGALKTAAITTSVTAATSAAARLLAVGSATRLVTFAFTSTGHRRANVAAAQTVTATRSSNVRWDSKANVSRSITAAFTPHAVYDPKIQATVLPGFPYQLPLRFGVTVKAVFSAFVTRFQRGDVSQTVTATRSAALRGSLTGNVTHVTTANRPVTGLRNAIVAANNQIVTATTTSTGLRTVKGDAALAITSTRTATGLRNARVSGLTTNVTIAISSSAVSGRNAISSLSASMGFSAAIKLTGSLASLTAVTAARTGTGLRNALVAASRVTSVSTSGAIRLAGSINAAANISAVEPTSVTEILAAVGNASGVTVVGRPAAATRNARVSASLTVTANRPTTIKWDSRAASLLSVTALRTPYAVYSTTVAAATMPGLPYELPLRFGVTFRASTSSTAGNAFTAIALPTTITANRTASVRAGWSTNASQPISVITNYPGFPYEFPFKLGGLQSVAVVETTLIANRPIVATPTAQMRLAGKLSGNVSAIAASPTVALRNVLPSALAEITAGTAAIGKLTGAISTSLTANATRSATALRSVFVDGARSVAATFTATTLRNARVSAATAITGDVTGAAVVTYRVATSLAFVATITAAIRLSASVSAAQTISLARSGSIHRTANVAGSLVVTDSSAAIANYNTRVTGSLVTTFGRNTLLNLSTYTSATTLPGFPYPLPFRFGVTAYATGTGNVSHLSTADVGLAVTAGRASTTSLGGKIAGSLVTSFVTDYPGLPYEFPYLLGRLNSKVNVTQGMNALLGASAVASSQLSQSAKISANRPTVASLQSSATKDNPIAALLVVKAKTVPCFPYYLPIPLSSAPDAQASALRNARVVSLLPVTINRPANMGILVKGDVSLAVNFVTNYPGFPYTLPHLLGRLNVSFTQTQSIVATSTFSANASITASRRQLLSATRVISANAQGSVANNNLVSANLIVRNALVPCFPYQLPITLSSVPNARATALRDAKVAAQLSVTGNRPSLIGFLLRGNANLAANFVTNYPGFPYTLPYLLGKLDTRVTLSQSIQALSVINSVGTANFSQNQKLQAARQIVFSSQGTILRNALITANLLAKSSAVPTFPYALPIPLSSVLNRQASAAREVKVGSNRIISVKGMSPTFMPGFPYDLPFRFNLAPAPTMSLETKVPALPTIITTGTGAQSQRTANISAPQTITATRQSVLTGVQRIDAHLTISPTQTVVPNAFPYTLPYVFATYRAAPPASTANILVYAASDTLAINARIYGFPYRLPYKLGPINAIIRQKFESVLNVAAIATLTAGNKLSALIVGSRPVFANRPAAAKYRGIIKVNNRPGFPYSLPLPLRAASFNITANRSAAAAKFFPLLANTTNVVAGVGNPIPRLDHGGRPNLPVTATATATMSSRFLTGSAQNITAIITSFSKYNVKVSSALSVSLARNTIINWYANSAAPAVIEIGTTANTKLDARLSANRSVTATSFAFMGSTYPLLFNTNGFFTFPAVIKRNAGVQSSLEINATRSASVQMRARIAAPTTLVSTRLTVAKADFKLAAPLVITNALSSYVVWRSSITSQSSIQGIADTNDSHSQDFAAGHTSVSANILSSAMRTRYLTGLGTSVTASRPAAVVLVWDGRASNTISFTVSNSTHRHARVDANLNVSAVPATWPIWQAHADSPTLDLSAITDTRGLKIRYLASIGTPAVVAAEASAEMYHRAGSFIPFFYVGG